MIILTLLEHLKPIKTDGKSIVDQDSLSITSVAPLGCPFMPKQGPGPPPEPALCHQTRFEAKNIDFP